MAAKLKVLDLFSGIGGFSLGLERTGGFETVAFCEIDPFCRRVLAKHWSSVPCFEDVTTLRGEDVGTVDVICGGFPCQDISSAGLGAGLDGARSGLWSEFARLIGELRPRFILVENVAALLGRGIDRVLGDMAALGYDAEWHCIPASAVGALHRRDRVWIVGHADRSWQLQPQGGEQHQRGRPSNPGEAMADTDGAERRQDAAPRHGLAREHGISQRQEGPGRSSPSGSDVADAERGGLQSGDVERAWSATIIPAAFGRYRGGSEFGEAWRIEPDVGRVAHGVSDGMDRLKGCGNAVVPQIPELIGNAILESLRLAA